MFNSAPMPARSSTAATPSEPPLAEPVTLATRHDITLETFRRVAWQGAAVTIMDDAIDRIAACRRDFLTLIDTDPSVIIYGVTTAMGELARHRLEEGQRT